MKKYFVALSTAALVSVAPYALASSTDLTVTGIITPSACTPDLSGGGVIDIGKISAKSLNQTTPTLVGRHPMQLTVSCDGPTKIALNPIDHNVGTANGDNWFGLGLTDNGEKLGVFRPNIKSTMADGEVVKAIHSPKHELSWMETTAIDPTTILSAGNGLPMPLKDLTMELEVVTYIERADSLTLKDEVTIDGSATIEMMYL